MNFLDLQLSPLVLTLLRILAALSAAFLGHLLIRKVLEWAGRTSGAGRLEQYAGTAAFPVENRIPLGSRAHRIRLAFARYGLDVTGRETPLLLLAQLFLGGGLTLLMLALGLPFFTSLVGILAGFVLVAGAVTRTWNRLRTEMEAEIPGLLSGLKSALATAPNVPQALAETARTLKAGGPLRAWVERAASLMHSEGQSCLETLRGEAAGVSSALSVCVELIGRMWTTGGAGYAEAFEHAAGSLREVLSARVLARARGAGAQSTTNLLMGMAFAMIVYLNHTPSIAVIVRTPLVQAAYAAIFLMIVYGYTMINGMIENAV